MSPTPRWLNAQERRAWLAYQDFSTHLSDYLNRQLRRDSGLTRYDYVLLVHLSEAPERALAMSELARLLKITRSRLTHAVTRLQDAGYVRRREDPENPRSQLAVLTDDGARLMEQAAPRHVEAVRRTVFDVLTPEQVRQFAEIGESINAALQRVDDTGADPDALPWRRR
ncbi:MarR family winged helix-turn-helix transcriptional regulator [Streptomyces viridochromogenes]|uniref:Putative MarR-family transcriptional regulator n=1 Tax=Streptomyces viridochromogenes Tue57 TaxID=1160705 RepID=L8PBY3_STRVR|nr:MarR family transcriptional regulator [Streptomyces viridochromogenes]ELS52837.1 putative MarR-family transcriptional regulator [Streptomyces viridochromogenes Tue57]